MAKPNQVPESSMEEILASIRKIISEDEARSQPPRPPAAPRPALAPQASNVSPLFKDEPGYAIAPDDKASPKVAKAPVAEPDEWVSARPIYPQFGELRGTSDRLGDKPAAREVPEPRAGRASPEKDMRPRSTPPAPVRAPTTGGTLLSPRADAAVASALSHLTGTTLPANARTLEQVAEDMLKPMLKDWLDENLPPLVERLVREEIERVSRRR